MKPLCNSMLSIDEKLELHLKFHRVFKSLSDQERLFISLHYHEDLTYREISNILNITVTKLKKMHKTFLTRMKE